jgi:hypothetical protein
MPILNITATSCTAIAIYGSVLKRGGKLVHIGLDAESMSRYGAHKLSVENDYIGDSANQAIIAANLLLRFSRPVPQCEGVTIIYAPTVEIGDRVHLTDTRTGVDNDYVIIGFSHDCVAQKTSLKLEATMDD